MPNYNKVILIGHLTRDPQLKQLQNTAVCEFGLAVNRSWKTEGGEKKEKVMFVDCKAFGQTGDLINKHFGKGGAIMVEGSLDFDQWEAQDGTKRSKHSVLIARWTFVGDSKKEAGDGPKMGSDRDRRVAEAAGARQRREGGVQRPSGQTSFPPPDPDDIPF